MSKAIEEKGAEDPGEPGAHPEDPSSQLECEAASTCTMDQLDFLVEGIREGSTEAAAALLRHFEPQVRRVIRAHLRKSEKLQRIVDCSDIYQSVFAAFIVSFNEGIIAIESPIEMIKLLSAMVRNKVVDYGRRCDNRITVLAAPQDWAAMDGNEETPSQLMVLRELLEMLQDRLTPLEIEIIQQRSEGRSWADLAKDEDTTPDALRKKIKRAFERAFHTEERGER